jgi:hypothetical protein
MFVVQTAGSSCSRRGVGRQNSALRQSCARNKTPRIVRFYFSIFGRQPMPSQSTGFGIVSLPLAGLLDHCSQYGTSKEENVAAVKRRKIENDRAAA